MISHKNIYISGGQLQDNTPEKAVEASVSQGSNTQALLRVFPHTAFDSH